jgi:hypothetical protein
MVAYKSARKLRLSKKSSVPISSVHVFVVLGHQEPETTGKMVITTSTASAANQS